MEQRMIVPFVDLRVSDPAHKAALLAAAGRVLDHGRMVLGPEVAMLEAGLSRSCSRDRCVCVSNGSAAVYLALRALDIGPGDEVITTPLSWIATLNAVVLSGATPVFADIDDSLNMDPASVASLISPRTKAILPVHFTGRLCPMEALEGLAAKHGLLMVEDAAQAFGATRAGRPAGSFGDVSAFSLNPMKVLHSHGEAGAVLTGSEETADRLVRLRSNGTGAEAQCYETSLNFRLPTILAAMLLEELPRLAGVLARRRSQARMYRELLDGVMEMPPDAPEEEHAWYTFTVFTDRRGELMEYLGREGVETKIHHKLLMPCHSAYKGRFKTDVPNADRLAGRILSLPLHENLTDDQIGHAARAVRRFHGAD